MRKISSILVATLAFAGVIAISVASAEAQSPRKKPANRGEATSGRYLHKPYGASAYYGVPVSPGGGINYGSRMGANYNPNQ